MSPELIQNLAYDSKSDIWALGCLIYELCARQPPFAEARTQAELSKLIRDGLIPSLPDGYSSQLGQLIRSMLRQNVRVAFASPADARGPSTGPQRSSLRASIGSVPTSSSSSCVGCARGLALPL